MLSKYFTFFAASAAVAFAYTLPTTQCLDKCNPIAHPGLNEPVPKGTTYTISWKPTTSGTVTILLYDGPPENLALIGPIVEKIDNNGTYGWKVPTSLKNDVTHYGIQLIDDADGTFQYSTQFGITGDSAASASGSSSSSVATSSSAASSTSASSSASVTAVTAVVSTTSIGTGMAASSGFPSNSTILSANPSISKPTTLDTATATGASSTRGSAASTSSAATNAADSIQMSFGGAAVALMAAIALL